MEKDIKGVELSGKVVIPPSKSDGQRAILCAGLSAGKSIIYNVGQSNDELAMIRNIQQFGAKVEIRENEIEVDGSINFPQNVEFNCGESGLGLRLMTSICSVFEGKHTLTGEGSILNRSQTFFSEEFPKMGLEVESNNGFLPITLNGHLKPGIYKVDGSQSSQYISGLLMALPLLKSDSELIIEDLKSKPYIDMTLSTLASFGIEIRIEGNKYIIQGNQFYTPTNYKVENDWSSASCWLAAAALGQKIELSGLSISSKQADVAMLDALYAANCNVEFLVDSIRVDGENRRAFTFDATDCPDLFPALVVLALGCSGKSTVKGVRRLKNKESDRGTVLQREFNKLGIKIELLDDEMHIFGG
ncbi:MAG: 3-phosphoshikimate 1-carboxyvinyltransferase, partial [Crocinitomicaceae bacterium]|nr:3-phosphoshikimate 1-carboxyvinyltransferase [Crocinitomicaceae bacterium]